MVADRLNKLLQRIDEGKRMIDEHRPIPPAILSRLQEQLTIEQVAHPTDVLLKDPPCLRSIFTRIQYGKLHFIIYFRSWDLWGGFPANLAGIQQMKEYIASSKGLHLYNYVWELAECLRGKTIEEFRNGL